MFTSHLSEPTVTTKDVENYIPRFSDETGDTNEEVDKLIRGVIVFVGRIDEHNVYSTTKIEVYQKMLDHKIDAIFIDTNERAKARGNDDAYIYI